MNCADAFDAYRSLIDSLLLEEGPELLLLVDARQGLILAARGAGARVLARTNHDLASTPVAALVPTGVVARGLIPFDPSMLESAGTFGEVAVEADDGPRAVSLRVQIFSGTDDRALSLVRMLDISGPYRLSSELRQMHLQLQQAFRSLRDQERALAETRRAVSLSIFASGLAHELNNPVAVLIANAAGLGQSVREIIGAAAAGTAPPEETLTDLSEMANEVGEMSRRVVVIVNSLKELEIVPRAGPFDAGLALRSLLTKWPGVTLKASGHIVLSSDALLLERALDRLLDNARRASGPTGPISVELSAEGPLVMITVDDIGPGVSENIRERVFDPFFTTRPPGKGLGLGLFLARRAAHRLGGDVTLEVEPSGRPGARFRLTLPATLPVISTDQNSYESYRSGKSAVSKHS